jgi:hypothetical protein
MSPWRLDSFEKPMLVEAKSQCSEKFPETRPPHALVPILRTASNGCRLAAVAAPSVSGKPPD